ncbi:MAG TPA: DUF4339 domain-containing protein [Xanthobacteraceae bacterium]
MADRQWYTAIGGKQEGPFSDQKLRELIAAGSVRADTLVWCDGMSNWARAAEIPGLVSSASTAAQQPVRAFAAAAAKAGGSLVAVADDRRLVFDQQQPFDRVWPLYWRVLVLGLSVMAVVPLPWAAPWFLRWFVERIELPDRQRVSFEGKPGDIWYIFIGYGLCTYASAGISLAFNGFVSLLLIPLTTFLALVVTRWFYANLVWPGRQTSLQFTGSYWGLLGWSVLGPLSFITIVGWAWVYAAWGRWMCRNVTGVHRQFVFTATGWGYLWRTLTLILTSYLVVAMPWTMRWYVRWLIAQFALIDETAPHA